MKIDEIKPIDLVVHKQRLCEEMMFQRMVKTKFLEDKTIKDLRELSHSLWIIISNTLFELEKCGTEFLVTDNIANSPDFINNIINIVLKSK